MFRRLLVIVCLMAPVTALAQGAQVSFGGSSQDTSAPVEVTADSLSINQSDGTALYSGNVLVVQDTMRLSAPRVLVVYSSGGGQIDRFEASGGVTLVSGEEAAEAERADYNVADGNVVMSGNVLMTQGNSALAAQRMTVNLSDGTAQLNGRVRTVLNKEKP
ncbi:MAG: LptA/OstA family protein [Pelagimonas sp.]|jgi:lipopolysaccharide export system protein LptA